MKLFVCTIFVTSCLLNASSIKICIRSITNQSALEGMLYIAQDQIRIAPHQSTQFSFEYNIESSSKQLTFGSVRFTKSNGEEICHNLTIPIPDTNCADLFLTFDEYSLPTIEKEDIDLDWIVSADALAEHAQSLPNVQHSTYELENICYEWWNNGIEFVQDALGWNEYGPRNDVSEEDGPPTYELGTFATLDDDEAPQ